MSDLEKDKAQEPSELNPPEPAADKPQAFDREEANETENENEIENGADRPAASGTSASAKGGFGARVALPWAIAVIAVVALVIVLTRGTAAGGMNEAVGEVGGEKVTKAELYDELVKQIGGEAQAGQVLDQYMWRKLIEYEAEKAGVEVTDADYAAALEDIKTQNGITSDEQLEQALAYSGITLEAYKEQAIRPQLLLRGIFEKNLAPTENDLKAYYEANKEKFGTPEQVKASHILLGSKEEAEAVLRQLKQGADFAKLAQEKSLDSGSKDNGGDLGFFGKGVMNEPFEKAAFALKKGEMSGVVESPNGFHIIKVTDRKEAVIPPYEEVKDKVKAAYLDSKVSEGLNDWLEKAKKDAGYKNFLSEKDAPASESPDAVPSASTSASPSASPSASASASAGSK